MKIVVKRFVVLLVDNVSFIKAKSTTLGWVRNQNDGTLASSGTFEVMVFLVSFVKSSCNLSNKLAAVHAFFVSSLAISASVPMD